MILGYSNLHGRGGWRVARCLTKKMEDILKKRLKESIGKDVKLVLQNDYIYAGKIINCDENYVEILDRKTQAYHLFNFEYIKDCEVQG